MYLITAVKNDVYIAMFHQMFLDTYDYPSALQRIIVDKQIATSNYPLFSNYPKLSEGFHGDFYGLAAFLINFKSCYELKRLF